MTANALTTLPTAGAAHELEAASFTREQAEAAAKTMRDEVCARLQSMAGFQRRCAG